MTRQAHTFRVRASARGVVLRVLLIAVVAVGVTVLNPYVLWQGIAIAAAVVAAVIPRSMAAWVAAACLPFGVLLSEPSPARTALAVLLVHGIHVLASLTLVVPARSRVALRVLVPTLARFVCVQVLAQTITFAAWLLVPSTPERGIGWIAPLAAAILLVAVVVGVRALTLPERPPGANVRGRS